MEAASSGNINYVSVVNSSTTTLGSNTTFTGTSESTVIYKSVIVSVFSDVSSATNGLSIQFSTNGTNWDFVYNYTITGGTAFSKTIQVASSNFRVVYTNGSSAQTTFRLQSILAASQDAENTSYPMTNYTPVYSNVVEPIDAFGDTSTTSKEPSIIVTFQYNINASIVTSTVTGTAAITQANAMAVLSTVASAGTARLQSIGLTQYTAGTGLRSYLTAVFNSGVAGTSQWVGAGNIDNGYFFGYNGTQFSIRHLNNSSDTFIAQTSWNHDTMNGSGSSGITLNPQRGNVYSMKIQWLGFGVVKFYIENPNNGLPILVHIINYGNINTVPSLNKTGFYGVATLSNGVTATAMNMNVGCIANYLEGNVLTRPGIKFSINNSASVASSTLQSVLSIRVRSTFAGVNNYVPILVDLFSFSVEGNKPVRFDVMLNPTNTFTWTNINTNQSVVEFSTTVATITTNTDTSNKYIFFLGKIDSQTNKITDNRLFVYPGQTITIACFTTNATNDNNASISWREFI